MLLVCVSKRFIIAFCFHLILKLLGAIDSSFNTRENKKYDYIEDIVMPFFKFSRTSNGEKYVHLLGEFAFRSVLEVRKLTTDRVPVGLK